MYRQRILVIAVIFAIDACLIIHGSSCLLQLDDKHHVWRRSQNHKRRDLHNAANIMADLKLHDIEKVISNDQLQNTNGESKQKCLRWAVRWIYTPKNDPVYDDVIKWKYFPRYWSFVRGIHRSPVKFPITKANDAELWCFLWSVPEQTVKKTLETPSDLRGHRTHYDVTVMFLDKLPTEFDFNTYDIQWNGVFVIPLRWSHMNAT